MWLLLLLLLTFNGVAGQNSGITELYEDLESEEQELNNATWDDYTFSETEIKKHLEVEGILRHYRECRGREWSCDKRCRLEFRSETKLCRAPFSGDNCFGIPITYKYSRDFDLIRFPRELAVLSRYPRCWSYLAPLICTTFYRPCSRHFFIEKDERNNVKNGTIELWQLLSLSFCETTYKMCADVVSSGLFPSMVKCEVKRDDSKQSRPKRVLYSSTCLRGFDQIPLSMHGSVCSWPLVSVPKSIAVDNFPVFDECFLPCRSPLISTYLSSRFRVVRFVICSVLAVIFFAISIYLPRCSRNFSESSLVFCVSHAMVSIAVYFSVWSVSVFEYVFTLADCSFDGVSRRYAISHSAFEWCSLQSFVLYAAFLSAFFWLFILYTVTVCPSYFLQLFFLPRSTNVHFRPLLLLHLYGFSALFSGAIMNNLRENDGVSGLCYNGLTTWWKYSISLSPLFFLFFFVVAAGTIILFKQDDLLKVLAKQLAEEGYHKRHIKFGDSNGIEMKEILKVNKHSSDNEADPNFANLNCQDKSSEVVQINSEWKRISNDLLPKNYPRQILGNEFDNYYHLLAKRLTCDRNFGLSSIWTVTSFAFVALYLTISPVIHYLYINTSPEEEIKSIVAYVNCGTAHAINNRSIDWPSDSTWPSPASLESSTCSLPLKEAQERLEGVFVVFIVLPALPFVVLLLAFLTGAMKVRGVFVDAEISKHHDIEELCELVPIAEKTTEHAESMQQNMQLATRDPILEGDGIVNEADASSKSNVNNRFPSNGPYETPNESLSDEKENCVKSENTEDLKQSYECTQEKEREKALINTINQLRGELAFQQSMLINDSAAWNVCLCYMRRTEQLLSQIGDQVYPVNSVNQGLRSLFEEISRVLPTVSDHTIQLWRWMDSVHKAFMKVDYLYGFSNNNGCPHSVFESQDVCRQHSLLALSNYMLRSQSRVRVKEKDLADISSLRVNHGEGKTNTQQECSSDKQSNIPAMGTQPMRNEQSACIPSTNQSFCQQYVARLKRERQIGPNEIANQNQQVPHNVGCDLPETSAGRIDARSHQTQRCQVIPRISAYAGSYSATPRGIFTRLSLPELRLRVQQIKNICAGDQLYPQELTYMLLVAGDITYGGTRPQEGQLFYTMEQLPGIFGTSVPTIDARVGVQDFLTQMRRRALTVVGAVGYHFSLHTTGGTSYTPPVLPPLGLHRSENELVLRRVLGDRDDVLLLLRNFLKEFQFGRMPISPRPDLKLAFSFRNYLAMVATREGFNNDHYEEYITDPVPPTETVSDSHDVENDRGESDDNTDPVPPS